MMSVRAYLPRFSIRELLVWTAFIGFACVSLRNASETWVAIAFAPVLAILGSTPLLIILRQGRQRAYWFGFGVIGSLYLALLMYGWSIDQNTIDTNPLSPDHLLTTRLGRYGHDAIYGQSQPQQVMPLSLSLTGGVLTAGDVVVTGVGNSPNSLRATSLMINLAGPIPPPNGPTQQEFVNVAHALWTLLLAAIGGWLARWLYLTKSDQADVGDSVAV